MITYTNVVTRREGGHGIDLADDGVDPTTSTLIQLGEMKGRRIHTRAATALIQKTASI